MNKHCFGDRFEMSMRFINAAIFIAGGLILVSCSKKSELNSDSVLIKHYLQFDFPNGIKISYSNHGDLTIKTNNGDEKPSDGFMKVNVYNDNSQYIKAILPKEISHNDVKLNDHKTLFQSKKVFILAKMLHYESNDKSKKLEKCLCQIKESGNGIDIGHPFIRYRIFTPYSKNEIRSEIDKFIDGISETDPNKKILLNSRSVLYQSFARFDIGERPGLYRLDLQIIIDNKALGNSLKIDYEIKGNDKLKEAFKSIVK